MKYNRKIFKSTKGNEVEFRLLNENDAENVKNTFEELIKETRFLLKNPTEFSIDVESERKWIQDHLDADNRLLIGIFVNGKYVGNGELMPVSNREKIRHRSQIDIGLREEFCNEGIGTELLKELIDYARKYGYEKLELGVFAINERAIHTYKKVGFKECGRIKNAFKLLDGSYSDEILMEMNL